MLRQKIWLICDSVLSAGPATLLKKRLCHRCFLVNFAKFLRTPILQDTSWRLLLLGRSTFACTNLKRNNAYVKQQLRLSQRDQLLTYESREEIFFRKDWYYYTFLRTSNIQILENLFSMWIQSQFPNTPVGNKVTETVEKCHHLHQIE